MRMLSDAFFSANILFLMYVDGWYLNAFFFGCKSLCLKRNEKASTTAGWKMILQ